LKWLSAAAASVTRWDQVGDKRVVESLRGVGIPWQGAALVDGDSWPLQDDSTLWLPPGTHVVEPGREASRLRIETFNGELKSARAPDPDTIELTYQSTARALAVLNRKPRLVLIDGKEQAPVLFGEQTVALPHGRHVVTIQ
jgi:hypothetical protein